MKTITLQEYAALPDPKPAARIKPPSLAEGLIQYILERWRVVTLEDVGYGTYTRTWHCTPQTEIELTQ